jgi:hypothetical protein
MSEQDIGNDSFDEEEDVDITSLSEELAHSW